MTLEKSIHSCYITNIKGATDRRLALTYLQKITAKFARLGGYFCVLSKNPPHALRVGDFICLCCFKLNYASSAMAACAARCISCSLYQVATRFYFRRIFDVYDIPFIGRIIKVQIPAECSLIVDDLFYKSIYY